MMKKIFLTLSIITAVICINSCTKESCNEDTDVFLHAVFYSNDSGQVSSVDSLDIYGLNIPDSVICSGSTLNNIDLPLNPSASNCSFAIINGGRVDTIDIYYGSRLQFVSSACGYIYLYELEEVLYTTNDIIKISIINEPVNPGDEENIQIFF